MPEESANFISELVPTNPDGTVDKVPILDNQIRLIKAVLQSQFPNFVAAAVNATVAELNKLAGAQTLSQLESVQAWANQQFFTRATLTDAPSIAWNLDTEQVAIVTLSANRTLANPTNMKNTGHYTLFVVQDATGSRTLSYGAAYRWEGGVAPVLSTGPNAIDIISFVSDGSFMYGVPLFGFA